MGVIVNVQLTKVLETTPTDVRRVG